MRQAFQGADCCVSSDSHVVSQTVGGCGKVTVVETFHANSTESAIKIRDTFNMFAVGAAPMLSFVTRFELYSAGDKAICVRDIETAAEAPAFAAVLVKSFTSEMSAALFPTLGIQSIHTSILQPSEKTCSPCGTRLGSRPTRRCRTCRSAPL